ncbi:hypothetical protein TOTORO_01470 [Serratia phage vB_SmaS-Totoro]|nr:hypothetical protein TOTORO_01470 [Serratia phage vB_SmaS-Totoro]
MKKILVLLSLALLTACDGDELAKDGISVVHVDTVNHRGVYRIEVQRTGKEYIGISGIGIIEVGSTSNVTQSVGEER